MSSHQPPITEEVIGNGSGTVDADGKDFQLLREAIQNLRTQFSPEENILVKITGIRFRMESLLADQSDQSLVSVGLFLKELVEVIQVPHKDFAAYVGLQNTNLSAIYRGSRKINHDLAMKIGHIFRINPALWLNLQNKIDLLAIQNQHGKTYQKYQLIDLLKKTG